MPYTEVNNVNLYYEVYGEGMPLMSVAGMDGDSQSWQPVYSRFDLPRYKKAG